MQVEVYHLRDFAEEAGYTVLRDVPFTQIGFLNHHGSRFVAPLFEKNKVEFLKKIGSRLAAVLTTAAIAESVSEPVGLMVADTPMDAFWRLHQAIGRRLERKQPLLPTVIAATAHVHPSAHIDERGVEIGPGSAVGPNASLIGRVVVGTDTVIGANVAIGSEGYQVTRLEGRVANVPHLGGVRLGDRVEVQAGTIIDRSLWPGFTEIADDTKVGGAAYIAHCSTIGQRCRVMTRSVVCGSVRIGDDAIVGVGAIVSNGVSIGNGAAVMISELVRNDIPEGMVQLQGQCIDQRKFARMRALSS
ncbi:hypothetical protein HGP14_34870 [Rhizobium sp. P32RR-XVIII]|uniref:hypothetical protein n=1 Tax=Rhizobium sp. P32RR-XVIII TaxID=2726738 RepID=UPI00145731B8|nr:hypothetical protein [Rhizobium sp. P32RR-XVIII]NLS08361.1 hypothetical protein [Rhizobium sp. P32RR-XVIII]